ncbi:hypothetical protein GCM10017673_04030 [Streptosporangium violaceochromogenes]|nr:hypothetical protein GCM10017673_04030 [Streptosporangium violaceochromogenes]
MDDLGDEGVDGPSADTAAQRPPENDVGGHRAAQEWRDALERRTGEGVRAVPFLATTNHTVFPQIKAPYKFPHKTLCSDGPIIGTPTTIGVFSGFLKNFGLSGSGGRRTLH